MMDLFCPVFLVNHPSLKVDIILYNAGYMNFTACFLNLRSEANYYLVVF